MNRVHALLTDEVTELEELHRRTKDADVRSRCQMILLSNEGLSPPKIAEQVRFHRRTVTRYIQRGEVRSGIGRCCRFCSNQPRAVKGGNTWRRLPG